MSRMIACVFGSCLLLVARLVSADFTIWPDLPRSDEYNRTTCRKAENGSSGVVLPCPVHRILLEDVRFHVKGGVHPDTFVRFSPDSRKLAIGTFLGHMKMLDIYSGKMLWDMHMAEGMVKKIDFSPDGKRVYFCEQSVDGFVIAAVAQTGKVLWRFRLADDLETGPPPGKNDLYGIYQLPGCYRLKTLKNGDLLVLGVHSWGDYRKLDRLKRLSRLYRFSPEGKLMWTFPKSAPMPFTLIYTDSDPNGFKVVALTGPKGSNASEDTKFHKSSLIVLEGLTGVETGQHVFSPLAPHFKEVGFWQSISVGHGGKTASVGMRDGRTFLMDLSRVAIRKAYPFGTPIMISNLPVSAMATYTHMSADGMAYFQTSSSSVQTANTMQRVVAPPGPHPLANTIHAVGVDGEIRWRFRSGHEYQNFWTSRDGRWLLTSVKRETKVTGRDSGGMLFDTHREGGGSAKLVFYYQVEGLAHFQADLAPDGSALAIVETPYRVPESGLLKGRYQVHVVR